MVGSSIAREDNPGGPGTAPPAATTSRSGWLLAEPTIALSPKNTDVWGTAEQCEIEDSEPSEVTMTTMPNTGLEFRHVGPHDEHGVLPYLGKRAEDNKTLETIGGITSNDIDALPAIHDQVEGVPSLRFCDQDILALGAGLDMGRREIMPQFLDDINLEEGDIPEFLDIELEEGYISMQPNGHHCPINDDNDDDEA